MPLDAARLLAHRFAPISQSYTRRDTILYALGIGLGANPLEEADLDYLLETRRAVLPAFVGTLASPNQWLREPAFCIDFARLLHVEQSTAFHLPLPPETTVEAISRIAGLYDRGEERGALLVVERTVADAASGAAYATITQTLLLRGDGGFGGPPPPAAQAVSPPDRDPDGVAEFAISPRAALIYRLSGDWNPLHADPAAARAAGFDRPILHGLATYGIAAHLLDRSGLTGVERIWCRFSGVVYSGDVLRLRTWMEADRVLFEADVNGRRVLDRGVANGA